MKSQENFISAIHSYQIIFENYVKEKTGLPEIPESTGQWNYRLNGYSFKFGIPELKYKGDLSDFPIFQENKPSFLHTLHNAMLDLSGLLIWNIILAMGAFMAFNRADVVTAQVS